MYIITLKTLSEKQRNEVLEWLRENKADSVQVRRKFSDVYPLAELLQPDFPRLIDLVNYPKRNGINLKIQNWETFNFKVLSKFNTMLGKEFIEELAKGNQCAVEILIYEMLRLRKQQVSKRQEQNAASEKEKEVEVEQQEEIKTRENEEITVVYQNEELKQNEEVKVVEQHEDLKNLELNEDPKTLEQKEDVKTLEQYEDPKTLELNEDPKTLERNQEEALSEASDAVDTLDKGKVTSRMILYARYQELSRECQAKWSMIRMYENHVIHLETLLQSREKEIEEMRQVIGGLQGTPL